MWGSVTSTVPASATCRTCKARADCARAVRALEPVACERTDPPGRGEVSSPKRSHRAYNPLKSQYAHALQPGQQFTTEQLATLTGRSPNAARAWVYDATHAGVVQRITSIPLPTGGSVAVYTYIPEGDRFNPTPPADLYSNPQSTIRNPQSKEFP
jgi:hypothetical protein